MNPRDRKILPDRVVTATAWTIVWLASLKTVAGFTAAMALSRTPMTGQPPPIPLWIHLVNLVVFAGAGSVLVLGSRRDRAALFLGAVFLCIASAFADPFLFRVAQSGPPIIAAAAAALFNVAVAAFFPAALWWFAGRFPTQRDPAGAGPSYPVLATIVYATGLLLFVLNLAEPMVAKSGSPSLHEAVSAVSRSGKAEIFWTILSALAIPAIIRIVWVARRSPSSERRRARLFLGGFMLGAAPVCLEILLEGLIPPFAEFMNRPGARVAGGLIVYPLILSIPVTTTYSVLVDHVIDLRIVLRQAARYFLARYSILTIASLPVAAAVAYLYLNREQTVADLLTGPGLVGIFTTAAIFVAVMKVRTPLLDWLDRRFFREQYDTRKILATLAQRARTVQSTEELAGLLAGEIDRALHLYSIAVLSIDHDGSRFTGRGSEIASLPRSSAWVEILADQSEPVRSVRTKDVIAGRMGDSLSHEDRAWIDAGGIEILVPMSDSKGSLIGIVALGEKRSGLAHSAEDESLLEAVASAGALALEVHLPPSSRSGESGDTTHSRSSSDGVEHDATTAMECTHCGRVWRPELSLCPECGTVLMPGRVPHELHGKFRIEARIGQGGMGVVYRAQDLVLGREIAIKTLPKLSRRLAERLRREAKAMASVTHPNLAAIHGAETWSGSPLLVFEYLSGGSLSDRLRSGPLDPAEAIELGVALSDALAVVHRSNILHRDIKPSNIGFSAEGTPKLLDFGLARVLYSPDPDDHPGPDDDPEPVDELGSIDETLSRTRITGAGHLVGTPMYLSPEALRGLTPDRSWDLWSLALTLYEAIAGSNPFRAETLRSTYRKILEGDVADIRASRPDCTEALSEFLREALHHDRKVRPESAERFGESLRIVRDS